MVDIEVVERKMEAARTLAAEAADSLDSDPVSRAAELKEWLSGQAARIEEAGRIPDDVAERLVAANLFRMTQPKRFGGLGLPPHKAWEAVFEVGRGCSSSAWLVGLVTANILMVGKFSDEAQREVFLGAKPAIVPVLTGGVGRDIKTERVEGGILLTGKWRYASGIDIASWVGLLIHIAGTNGAEAEQHVVLVPQSEFSIDHESWKVLGMRGTGSKDVSLSATFVPEHRWTSWALLQAGGKHEKCSNDEHIFDYPLNTVNAMSVLAPTLGVASAVADEFRELVMRRVSAGTQQHQIEDKIAQVGVARGIATAALLRKSLVTDAAEVLHKIEKGTRLAEEDRAAVRMRIAMMSRLALGAAQDMFAAVGGSLLPSGSRMERLFRDLHAMSSHFLLQSEPIGEAYGKFLLGFGFPPGARL